MSIQRLHDRLDAAGRRAASNDTGLTMAEVIVALFVFTVFILGLGYSLLSMTRLVSDSGNREVAASLASQEIDRVRAIPDAFDVLSSTTTQTVNGITYKIKRVAGWVTASGSTASCGSGGGNLQDKAVDVQVTWPSQYMLTSAIRSTTILAPTTRINDPSFGTIIVSVLGADGAGRPGVTVTVTADSGSTGVSPGAVDSTDVTGCSYVLKVVPGAYHVTVSTASYVDIRQQTSPSYAVVVPAGGSQTAPFSYDARATFNVAYASNYTGTGTVKLPAALATNFMSTTGLALLTTTTPTVQYLYPFTDGYSTIAGNYADASSPNQCASVDPLLWPAGQVNGVNLAAGARPKTAVAAGSAGPIGVQMGVIQATWPAVSATSITIKNAAAPAGTGDPDCATPASYDYSFATTPAAGTAVYLAVPFGSWQVYSKLASTLTILPSGNVTNATQGEVTGNIITLDPRIPS